LMRQGEYARVHQREFKDTAPEKMEPGERGSQAHKRERKKRGKRFWWKKAFLISAKRRKIRKKTADDR